MSSPYLKLGLLCSLFATVLGITFYAMMPDEPANDYRYNGLSSSAVPPPPPPPAPMAPPPPPPPPAPANIDGEDVYTIVEEMPLFPGCEDISDYKERKPCSDRKLIEYVYSNVKYPEEATKKGVEGMVVVRFKVSAKGKVFGAEVLRDPGAGLGDEALRVVNSMKTDDIRWTPGKQGGKAVAVKFTLPVKFKLE